MRIHSGWFSLPMMLTHAIDGMAPQLEAGADAARTDALATTAQWGISVTQGGLHWATYKATTRRHGVFRINMNEAPPRRAHLPSLGP